MLVDEKRSKLYFWEKLIKDNSIKSKCENSVKQSFLAIIKKLKGVNIKSLNEIESKLEI